MKRPDFIIGGATHSGMDGLIATLDHHPQIFVAQRKEHRFFVQGAFLNSAPEPAKEDFEDANNIEGGLIPEDRILRGEVVFDPERAHQGCPNAKVIFILRNPSERAHSQFFHALSERKETVRSFENAIEAELSGLRSPETTGRCWLYKNQYQKHLEHWLSLYPKENLKILIYEEWIDSIGLTLDPIENFLNLKPKSLAIMSSLRDPEPRKKSVLKPIIHEKLDEMFEVDKNFVSKLVGREISAWKSP